MVNPKPKPGFSRNLFRRVSERDICLFAEASGDHNPIHLDESYAKETRFGGRIAHGMLTASFISATISRMFEGAVYVSQELNFTTPVRIGSAVSTTVRVDLVQERPDDYIVWLTADCMILESGKTCLKGAGKILVPK